MKTNIIILLVTLVLFFTGCKHTGRKGNTGSEITIPAKDVIIADSSTNLIIVAKDIVTEVIVKPDTTGDPWEMEKVKNYNGDEMISHLFTDIYKNKYPVYDILTGSQLDPVTIRSTAKEFGNDISKISKIQFLEDWYFDPSSNKMIKKIKSISFAYAVTREKGLPPGHKALFKIKQ
jgi:hypothetical protein